MESLFSFPLRRQIRHFVLPLLLAPGLLLAGAPTAKDVGAAIQKNDFPKILEAYDSTDAKKPKELDAQVETYLDANRDETGAQSLAIVAGQEKGEALVGGAAKALAHLKPDSAADVLAHRLLREKNDHIRARIGASIMQLNAPSSLDAVATALTNEANPIIIVFYAKYLLANPVPAKRAVVKAKLEQVWDSLLKMKRGSAEYERTMKTWGELKRVNDAMKNAAAGAQPESAPVPAP